VQARVAPPIAAHEDLSQNVSVCAAARESETLVQSPGRRCFGVGRRVACTNAARRNCARVVTRYGTTVAMLGE
jgi:hypothetical protein